jgi:hypothetical protein
MAHSNSVDLPIGLNSRLKRDYGSKTRERKNSDTKGRSFYVTHALPLVVMLSHWGVCISRNRVAVPSCKINVRIGQSDKCEFTPR